jgi:hypothetical protein
MQIEKWKMKRPDYLALELKKAAQAKLAGLACAALAFVLRSLI